MEISMEFADHSQGINITGNPKSRSRRVHELVVAIWSFTWHPIDLVICGEEPAVSAMTEASDLDANRHVRPRNQCPCCDNFFMKKHLVRTITVGEDEDTEVGGWIFRCPSCRAHLTILND